MDKKSNIIRFPVEKRRPDLRKGKGFQITCDLETGIEAEGYDPTLYALLEEGDPVKIWNCIKEDE